MGLFGNAYGSNVSIKNLTVKDFNIQNSNYSCTIGAIAGLIDTGKIENCASVNGSITGTGTIGGIAGDAIAGGAVNNCYNTSTLTSTASGTNNLGSSGYRVGGITGGGIDGGNINNCYNTGTISAPNSRAGGICGAFINYNIYACYNVGTVTGNIAGDLFGEIELSEIENCYYLSGKTPIGDNSSGTTLDIHQISLSDLKLASAVTNLNKNGYSAFKQDTYGINNGYPILSWQ